MSYCTGKNIEIARGKAIKMLVVEKKPVRLMQIALGFIEVLSGDDVKNGITTRLAIL